MIKFSRAIEGVEENSYKYKNSRELGEKTVEDINPRNGELGDKRT